MNDSPPAASGPVEPERVLSDKEPLGRTWVLFRYGHTFQGVSIAPGRRDGVSREWRADQVRSTARTLKMPSILRKRASI